QRHVRADVDRSCFAVQGETDGHGDLPVADRYPTTTTGQDENPQNLVLSRAQVGSTDRQPPHAFSRRRENGIGKRRGSRGNTRFAAAAWRLGARSEEHTSELQSRFDLVCRLLLEKKIEKNDEFTYRFE